MSRLDVVKLGASLVKNGVALWQAITNVSEDNADIEPLGDGDVFQALGLTSRPSPATKDGHAEGVCVRGIAGRDVTYVGGRDTRNAAVVNHCKAGDTILHSTGPQQASQVICKEEKRQVIMSTKDKNGKGMAVILDGETGKFQVTIPGMFFEMDSSTGVATLTNGDSTWIMDGGTTALDSNVIAGGRKAGPAKVMVSTMVGKVPKPTAIGATGAGVTYATMASAAKGFSVAG